jgi:hypothetical protein
MARLKVTLQYVQWRDEESEYIFLANIFILRKTQVSSVYHNYSGLLNIGALLQRCLLWETLATPLYVEIKRQDRSSARTLSQTRTMRILF